jgi:salicylate hydroxylase
LINREAPTFASPEEEDEALKIRMRNRPDLQWLSEHDVEQTFNQVAEDLEKQDTKVQSAARASRLYDGAESALALPAVGSKL